MRFRRYSGLVVVAVILSILAGCGSKPAVQAPASPAPAATQPADQTAVDWDSLKGDALYAALAKLPVEERAKRIEEGAKKEGKLVYYTGFRGAQAKSQVDLFNKRYPFLKIEYTELGTQDVADRFLAEETAGKHLADAIFVTVPDLTAILPKDILARFPTPATDRVLPPFRGFLDPENRWTPFIWSEQGISYNSKMISKADAPKDWQDLCDPKYKGQFSVETFQTRFIGGIVALMGEAGMEKWLECIKKNDPIIQRGFSERVGLMLAGDHAIQGHNYFYNAVEMKKKDPSLPFEMVFSAPVIGWAGAVEISKAAPHPYAAALFADWVLSDESAKWAYDSSRGAVTGKHPFIPDTAKIVYVGILKDEDVKRWADTWNRIMGAKN